MASTLQVCLPCVLFVNVGSTPILYHIGEMLGIKIPFRAFLTQPTSARLSMGAPTEPNSNGRLGYQQGQ